MHRSRLLIACAIAMAAGLVASAVWREPSRSTTPLDPAAVPAPVVAPAPSLGPEKVAPPDAQARPNEGESSRETAMPRHRVALDTAPDAASHGETTVAAAAPPPGAAGRVVAIDPETGQLGPPSAEQLRELMPPGTEVESLDENAQMVYRPDGIVLMVVGPRIQEYSYVQIGPDGQLVYGCGPVSQNPGAQAVVPALAPALEER